MYSASRDAAACVLTVPFPQDFASLHRRTAIADGTPYNMLYSGANGCPSKEDDCTEVLGRTVPGKRAGQPKGSKDKRKRVVQ